MRRQAPVTDFDQPNTYAPNLTGRVAKNRRAGVPANARRQESHLDSHRHCRDNGDVRGALAKTSTWAELNGIAIPHAGFTDVTTNGHPEEFLRFVSPIRSSDAGELRALRQDAVEELLRGSGSEIRAAERAYDIIRGRHPSRRAIQVVSILCGADPRRAASWGGRYDYTPDTTWEDGSTTPESCIVGPRGYVNYAPTNDLYSSSFLEARSTAREQRERPRGARVEKAIPGREVVQVYPGEPDHEAGGGMNCITQQQRRARGSIGKRLGQVQVELRSLTSMQVERWSVLEDPSADRIQ